MSCRLGVLSAAALAVASLGAQELSFDAALVNLGSPDSNVRIDTIRRLEASGYAEAAVPIAALITDPSNAVQRAAIEAELSLFVLDMAPRRRRVALFIERRGDRSATTAFEQGPLGLNPLRAPSEVVSALAMAIADDDPGVRWEAVFALGTLGTAPAGEDVAQRLILMLRDPDPQMRLGAALVAGRLGVTAAGETLVYLLNDPDGGVQLAALEALGDLREARAAVALAQRVEFYERGPSAEAALRSVARIGHRSSRPLFESFTGSGEASLRRFAYEGLGRVGEADAVAALQQAAADESVAEAYLASQFALQMLNRPVLPALIDGLRDRRLARQARDYLIELGSPIVRTLERYVHDGDAVVRVGVADVLGLIGDTGTIEQLDAVRSDTDVDVAAIATRAIERIRMRLSPGGP